MKYREPFRLSQNQEHHHNNRFVLFATTIQDRDRIPNPQGQPSRSLGSQHYLHSVVLLVCMLMSEFLSSYLFRCNYYSGREITLCYQAVPVFLPKGNDPVVLRHRVIDKVGCN